MNKKIILLLTLLSVTTSYSMNSGQKSQHSPIIANLIKAGQKDSQKRDMTQTYKNIRKYINLKQLCLNLAGSVTEEDINNKEVLKDLINAINMQRLPEVFESDSKTWNCYTDLEHIKTIAINGLDGIEIMHEDLLKIIKVSACATLLGMDQKAFEECVKLDKLASVLNKLFAGKTITKAEFLEAVNLKKLETYIQREPAFLKEYLHFKTLLSGFNDALIGEEVDRKKLLHACIKALNWPKILAALLNLNRETLERCFNFDQVKVIAYKVFDRTPVVASDIEKVINFDACIQLFDIEPVHAAPYINKKELSQLIADILNSVKVTKARAHQAIKFRKIERDLGLKDKELELAFTPTISDGYQLAVASKLRSYGRPDLIHKLQGIALWTTLILAHICEHTLTGTLDQLEPQGMAAKAAFISVALGGSMSYLKKDIFYLAKFFNTIKSYYTQSRSISSTLSNGVKNFIGNDCLEVLNNFFTLPKVDFSIDGLIKGTLACKIYKYGARKNQEIDLKQQQVEIEPGEHITFDSFANTLTEDQMQLLSKIELLALAEYKPDLLLAESTFINNLTPEQYIQLQCVIKALSK